MWRLTAAYLIIIRPRVTAGLVAITVALIGGYGSLPQMIRPVEAADVPVIQPVVLKTQTQTPLPDTSVDCAKVACMALTFDDGPSAEITPRILDILDAHHAKATFFLIGERVPGNEALLRRMHTSGYEIGNHTWSHYKINEISPDMLQNDIARAQQVITAAGVPTPQLFRPPYGLFNPMIRSHVQMTVVAWNIDPEDWRARKPEQITEHILTHAKSGGIVDLHDTEQFTADALDSILSSLEQQYQLVTVSELLDLSPGQPGIFYGR